MNNTITMKIMKISTLVLSFVLLVNLSAKAQNGMTEDEKKRYEKEIVDMVEYIEGTFNFLGSADAPASEKEIVISSSYAKVFRDDKVQIEDDLDENRKTPMNKDVQSYLQDIDFFFKEAAFTFDIESIKHAYNEKKEPYFMVTMNRNLKATDIKGNEINNNKPRFMEIALNEEERDLKIISFYTTKLDETADLRYWWDNLPLAWQDIFRNKLNFSGKPTDTQIKNITSIKELNISGKLIMDLLPLSRLTRLRKVDCSNTSIADVTGLRNLIHLESLNCSNTKVSSFDALKYTTNLRILYFNNTLVSDISQLENFMYLQQVQMNKTLVKDLTPLQWAEDLIDLRFNETNVTSISPLKELTGIEILYANNSKISNISTAAKFKNLKVLDIGNTSVSDVSVLSKLPELQKLIIDNTSVNEIASLSGMKSLTRIYCDNTEIKSKQASDFMQKNRQALVMYDSQILFSWWKAMPTHWKEFFKTSIELSGEPGKEELQRMANIQEVSMAKNANVKSIEVLSKLNKLEKLDVSETEVSDLTPLLNLLDLKEINISKTKVSVLNPILNLTKLQKLDISNTMVSELLPLKNTLSLEKLKMDNTKVSSISILNEHKNLQTIYADKTGLTESKVENFNAQNPECLVIYQTDKLNSWWTTMDKKWKEFFKKEFEIQDKPDRVQAHQLTKIKELSFSGDEFTNLKPLSKLKGLEALTFSDTRITDLKPISGLKHLKVLKMPVNPGINNLSPIGSYSKLEVLDIQNTLVKDLSPLGSITSLKIVKINGTKVMTLKHLAGLINIEQLEFYNTNVWFLKPLYSMKTLEKVKCYNTKVLNFFVKKYKEANPKVDVVHY